MILFNEVCYSYPDGHTALNNINLTIKDNECVGLVGANGAGKTTLLFLLTGILYPSLGDIQIDKIKIEKSSLKSIRKKIGMFFQNPDDQLFMNSVYDDVAFGLINTGLLEEEVEKKVNKALNTTNTLHLMDKKSYRLSSGEKRRIAIASVLAMEPEILIMDEPSTSLDPKSRRGLIDLLSRLEYTKLIASHDLDLVLDLCNRVLIMKDGMIIADGSPKILFKDNLLMEISDLEVPYRLRQV